MKKIIFITFLILTCGIILADGCGIFPNDSKSVNSNIVGSDEESNAESDKTEELKRLKIQDGIGVGIFELKTSAHEMKSIYGNPDYESFNSEYGTKSYFYNDIGLVFRENDYISARIIDGVEFRNPYQGKTLRGVGIGDSRPLVVSNYGASDDLLDRENWQFSVFLIKNMGLGEQKTGTIVAYKEKGIAFVFNDISGGVVELIVIFL